MKLARLLSRFQLDKVRLDVKFLQVDITFTDRDKAAAWDLYVEMLTRIATQPLPSVHGSEKHALESVYSLFPTTRQVLRAHGPGAIEFAKVAIPVLNQVVPPFTAKWHQLSLQSALDDQSHCLIFRKELASLQVDLRNYNRVLAAIAGVEDLTSLESPCQTGGENDQ